MTEEYDRAERQFGDGVCDAAARDLHRRQRRSSPRPRRSSRRPGTDIDAAFTEMEAQFPEWAAQERARFSGMLDGLSAPGHRARRPASSRDVSRGRDHRGQRGARRGHRGRRGTRPAALLGRIVAAIEEFIDDPVRAIINGLLTPGGHPAGARSGRSSHRSSRSSRTSPTTPRASSTTSSPGSSRASSSSSTTSARTCSRGFWNWLFSGLEAPIPMPTRLLRRGRCSPSRCSSWASPGRGVREILVRHVGEPERGDDRGRVAAHLAAHRAGPAGHRRHDQGAADPRERSCRRSSRRRSSTSSRRSSPGGHPA